MAFSQDSSIDARLDSGNESEPDSDPDKPFLSLPTSSTPPSSSFDELRMRLLPLNTSNSSDRSSSRRMKTRLHILLVPPIPRQYVLRRFSSDQGPRGRVASLVPESTTPVPQASTLHHLLAAVDPSVRVILAWRPPMSLRKFFIHVAEI